MILASPGQGAISHDECPKVCVPVQNTTSVGVLPAGVIFMVDWSQQPTAGEGEEDCSTCPDGSCRSKLDIIFDGQAAGMNMCIRVGSGPCGGVGMSYTRPGIVTTSCNGNPVTYEMRIHGGAYVSTVSLTCPCDN